MEASAGAPVYMKMDSPLPLDEQCAYAQRFGSSV